MHVVVLIRPPEIRKLPPGLFIRIENVQVLAVLIEIA